MPNTFSISAKPVIAAAGDIACDPVNPLFSIGVTPPSAFACHATPTSNLLVGGGFSAVLPLGDLQYDCGGYNKFLQSYDLTWGHVKWISHPVPGNHEYRAPA